MVGLRVERMDVKDATLKCVDEFCYLGDMIVMGGGTEATFKELLLLLTMKGLFLCMKRSLFAA